MLPGLPELEPHQFQDWFPVPGRKADVVICLLYLAKGQSFLAADDGDKASEERKETLHSLSIGTEASSLHDSSGSRRQHGI